MTARRLLGAAAVAALALHPTPAVGKGRQFSNQQPVTVPRTAAPPGCPFTCPATIMDPYPSTIAVSGLSGTVTKVRVILKDFGYAADEAADVDVMLVAPTGSAVMLMSDVCGVGNTSQPAVDGVTLTLDDAAKDPIPADAPCTTGSYQPLDDDDDEEFAFTPTDTFPPNAPAAPASTLPLSTFNGSDPNGTWMLYGIDDYPADPGGVSGQFAGGWSLEIATSAGDSDDPGAGESTGTTSSDGTPLDTRETAARDDDGSSGSNLVVPGLGVAAAVALVALLAARRARSRRPDPAP